MDESHLGSQLDDGGAIQDESINISDVIEVIATDPDFQESSTAPTMFNGGGEISQQQPPVHVARPSNPRQGAFVRIIEQPASKALRFRYECEGRSAGSIPGASSTPENKTFPAIQVVGYTGRAVVVVSCVTKDEPYRAHPHNLVGREGCKQGVCTMEMPRDTMCMTFSNLGIQCVKKKDIESALRVREEIKVDPFRAGFAHRSQPTTIDLNAVRLCFQVFIEGERRGKVTIPLDPVVSEPIYDKKAMSDLLIVKLSHCNSFVDGGRNDIILLCEKVAKEDIQVRFFEEKEGRVVWEGLGEFQPSQVHKQTAISFKAPRYRTLDITEPVKVFIQLRRPSDGATSEALPFEFLPLDSEPGMLRRKRQKIHDPNRLLKTIEDSDKSRNLPYELNIPGSSMIKLEPRDKSPSPYGGQLFSAPSPVYATSVSPNTYLLPTASSPHLNPNLLPPIDTVPQPNWSMLGAQSVPLTVQNQPSNTWQPQNNLSAPSGNNTTEVLYNMDTNQMQDLQPIELLSGELNVLAAASLSDAFAENVSISDMPSQSNMSDSLTRLLHGAFDNMVNDNNNA